jgi:hypothetical protein
VAVWSRPLPGPAQQGQVDLVDDCGEIGVSDRCSTHEQVVFKQVERESQDPRCWLSGRALQDGSELSPRCRGAGPLLLLLQGGDSDADAMSALTAQLEDRYTLLSYDRCGLSRSPSTAPTWDLRTPTPRTLHGF